MLLTQTSKPIQKYLFLRIYLILMIYFLSTSVFAGKNSSNTKIFMELTNRCLQGDTASCLAAQDLGNSLIGGISHLKNGRYFSVYKNKCSQGDYDACYTLAEHYENGVGVFRDLCKAFGLYKYSCNKGTIAEACSRVSSFYSFGYCVKRNDDMADKYSQLACDYGLNEDWCRQ